MNIAWSYSSLKTFQQCPKKYYHLKVAKDVQDKPTAATMYGQEVHKVAEDFIKDKTPIPEKYSFVKPFMEVLDAIPGTKYCEHKMGLTRDLQPCGFFDKNVWWRGIADLLVINEEKGLAHSIDYKTGKSAKYADKQQLDLVAVAIFAHFPNIVRVKSGLLFVVSKEFVKSEHNIESKDEYIGKVLPDLDRLEKAMDNGVWNPISGPLCRFCPVKSCTHNRSE